MGKEESLLCSENMIWLGLLMLEATRIFFGIKRWDHKFSIFLVLHHIIQYLQKLLLPHNWINRQKYNWVGTSVALATGTIPGLFIQSHLFHLVDMILGASNPPCLIQTERWPQNMLHPQTVIDGGGRRKDERVSWKGRGEMPSTVQRSSLTENKTCN